jgi:hypothetical protein
MGARRNEGIVALVEGRELSAREKPAMLSVFVRILKRETHLEIGRVLPNKQCVLGLHREGPDVLLCLALRGVGIRSITSRIEQPRIGENNEHGTIAT